MAKFSERMGLQQPKLPQIDSMDMALRNGIFNTFYDFYFYYLHEYDNDETAQFLLVRDIWANFLKNTLTSVPETKRSIVESFSFIFNNHEYYEIFDLIEFTLNSKFHPGSTKPIIEELNRIFEREFAAYRIVDKLVTPLINEIEIESVKSALLVSQTKYGVVRSHLRSALEKLSDRDSPDYRNSFKESMLAIEAICMKMTNDPKATLGQAIKELAKTHTVHPAQEKGFSALYGYSSDEGGIRHGMWDESTIDQSDALYMLVTASAFINFLIAKTN